jgi:hypothetical protein
VRRLLVIASVVPSSPIPVTLIKVALSSSEVSVLTRATRRNIPEDAILHNYILKLQPTLFSESALTGLNTKSTVLKCVADKAALDSLKIPNGNQ